MIPISAEDLENFKTLLLRREVDLLEVKATGDSAASVVELDQSTVGRLSRMDAMQAQAMSVETNRRREVELQRIGTALQRLRDDEYGFCLKCGEEIARQRLKVDPSTPICIDCANRK